LCADNLHPIALKWRIFDCLLCPRKFIINASISSTSHPVGASNVVAHFEDDWEHVNLERPTDFNPTDRGRAAKTYSFPGLTNPPGYPCVRRPRRGWVTGANISHTAWAAAAGTVLNDQTARWHVIDARNSVRYFANRCFRASGKQFSQQPAGQNPLLRFKLLLRWFAGFACSFCNVFGWFVGKLQ